VHQVGTLADGRPYMAMKLIKGSSLEDILKDRPDPAADHGRLLAIFEAVCQAVGYAHAHRVIHRNLKTVNVMVGAFGEVQVIHWGLAKVVGEPTPATAEALTIAETRTGLTRFSATPSSRSHTQHGSMVGTPAFIAPEQAAGEIDKVSQRSDVFGLGALLAVILTGNPPYVGDSESVRVQAVRGKLEDCFARLDTSGAEPELVALCKHCLAFEPADRPADGGAVAETVAGLRAAAGERAQRAEVERVRVEREQATALARLAEHRKRRRLVIGAAAVLAVAMIVGLLAVLLVQR
jgi:serine/threonine protein kinase